MITKSRLELTLPALKKMLRSLPALHTIQIVSCKVSRELQKALKNVVLPSVRMLVLGDGAAPFLKACPNVTHVRVCDHRGLEVIANLKHCPMVEVFDGNILWGTRNDEAMRRAYRSTLFLIYWLT